MTANLPGKIDGKLKAWIEELLPERQEAEGGAEPLNLEELQHALDASKGRDAMKQQRSRAA